jgi:hypothetical protein
MEKCIRYSEAFTLQAVRELGGGEARELLGGP